MKNQFVGTGSIVRKIWGKSDTLLFIFAGAAAEFALNKAVDWLYFTGRLPADPLGRLFSTVAYARKIIFAEQEDALKAIDQITGIHKAVEKNRGQQIPGWAYLDVLFLLIDYSIRSFELLERKLTKKEKQEVFDVFYRVGLRMQLVNLPASFDEWTVMRQNNLETNLINSEFTKDLYIQYKKNLGFLRYQLLKQVQLVLVPEQVKKLLLPGKIRWITPIFHAYKTLRQLKLEKPFKNTLLPAAYKKQINELDGEG
jgi:uncharacterized protein (DUF2236 family)